MPEYTSFLTTPLTSGVFGAKNPDGAGVELHEAPIGTLVQIAGWGGFDEAAGPGLKTLGFVDTGDYRTCHKASGIMLFRIAPDRVLIAGQSGLTMPESILDHPSLAVLDISHARTRIVVNGPDAEKLMARLAPVDFCAQALPVQGFVQTGIHHIGVLIHRTGDMTFEIHVPVTWVRSIWELICLNATPLGYRVKAAA